MSVPETQTQKEKQDIFLTILNIDNKIEDVVHEFLFKKEWQEKKDDWRAYDKIRDIARYLIIIKGTLTEINERLSLDGKVSKYFIEVIEELILKIKNNFQYLNEDTINAINGVISEITELINKLRKYVKTYNSLDEKKEDIDYVNRVLSYISKNALKYVYDKFGYE